MKSQSTVSTRQSLAISLLRAREAVMQHFRPHLAELGLTEQQWRVLRVLGESRPQEAGIVAERACVLPPSLSRILKTLAEEGLVATEAHSDDARRTLVNLTAKGRALLKRALPKSAAIYAQLEARIGKDKLSKVLDLLEDVQISLK